MTHKFTAEEVRAIADAMGHMPRVYRPKCDRAADMLTAYAERIEADERAVPMADAIDAHLAQPAQAVDVETEKQNER